MPRFIPGAIALLLAAAPLAAQARPALVEARLDSIFARQSEPGAPGCALGVAEGGRVVVEGAWGLADLEREIPITPETIFEAGSVSKQFTAAAVLLLARDGKLSLDDDVRRWMPELPDYGASVTLRHLLHHTSGLRDWGSMAGIAGWPRDTRALSHAHVLAITSRVRELNFPPGSEYDYSNTNYNLLAMVAERASGQSFPEFTRKRIFEPLGMTSTSWRADATRLVPGRAPSYSPFGASWRAARAIENIYGNCCLLTTVGDLLKWNAAFEDTRLGGAGFREEQERRGVLNGGRVITYAAGLVVTEQLGEAMVAHSGATAGYRAFLARFPERRLSIAVLCNRADANAPQLGSAVARLYLPPRPTVAGQSVAPARATVAPDQVLEKAGLYRNNRSMIPQRFVAREGRLRTEAGIELVPQSPTLFVSANDGSRVHFDPRAGGGYNLRLVTPEGDTIPAEGVAEADTAGTTLAGFTGAWHSDEADATFVITQEENDRLMLRRDPSLALPLQPIYRDGFRAALGILVFRRDAAGRVVEMRFTTNRVRNLRFVRQPS